MGGVARRRGGQHGEHGQPGEVEQDPPRPAVAGDQERGGDQRREPAGEHGADLVAQGGAAVAQPQVEQLGEPRRLRPVHRVVHDVDAQHHGGDDEDGRAGVHREEEQRQRGEAADGAEQVRGPPPDAVGHPCPRRRRRDPQRRRDQHGDESGVGVRGELVGDVGQAVGRQQRVERDLRQAQTGGQHDRPWSGAQHLDHRQPGHLTALAQRAELRRVLDPQPDGQPDHDQDDARQERQPPAPGQELLGVGQRPDQEERSGREQHSRR